MLDSTAETVDDCTVFVAIPDEGYSLSVWLSTFFDSWLVEVVVDVAGKEAAGTEVGLGCATTIFFVCDELG